NTGWTGGGYGVGKRISLAHTRALLDAVHSGELQKGEFESVDVFGLKVPKQVSNVPSEILNPKNSWSDKDAYMRAMNELTEMFEENNKKIMATPVPVNSKSTESSLK